MSDKPSNNIESVNIDQTIKKVVLIFIGILLFPLTFYLSTLFKADEVKVKKILVEEVVEANVDGGLTLVEDEGYEIVKGTCSACHSIALVTQNRATREGWKDLIVWMQETQKLWDLGENEELILDYLEKNYAPEEQGRRAPLKDIDWYEL